MFIYAVLNRIFMDYTSFADRYQIARKFSIRIQKGQRKQSGSRQKRENKEKCKLKLVNDDKENTKEDWWIKLITIASRIVNDDNEQDVKGNTNIYITEYVFNLNARTAPAFRCHLFISQSDVKDVTCKSLFMSKPVL